jgi:hypothetical protein
MTDQLGLFFVSIFNEQNHKIFKSKNKFSKTHYLNAKSDTEIDRVNVPTPLVQTLWRSQDSQHDDTQRNDIVVK